MADLYGNETEAERRQREQLASTQPTGGSALPMYGSPESVTSSSQTPVDIEPMGGYQPPPPGDPPPQPPPGPDVPPPADPPPAILPGGAIDPAAFQEMFNTAFQPFQEQFTGYQTQQQEGQQSLMDLLNSLMSGQEGLAGGQQGMTDQFGNVLSGQEGIAGQFEGIPGVDLTGLAGGQESVLDQLMLLLSGQEGLGEQVGGLDFNTTVDLTGMQDQLAGLGTTLGGLGDTVSGSFTDQTAALQEIIAAAASGQDTGLTPEQLQAALTATQEAITNQMAGQQTAGSEQFTGLQDQLTAMQEYFNNNTGTSDAVGGGDVGGAVNPQETTLTPEQLENIFGGTGDQNQTPGFMYGPDYFRAGTDYMTELAASNPAGDVMGAMGDVLSAGPSSYGEMGETLAGRLASPSVYEGELGQEALGMIRGLSNINTDPYQQLLSSGMSRIGEEEQRAIDQQMMQFNRMGLTPENQASGTIINPLSRTLDRFAQTRGDLMSQLALQQGSREDQMRQAQAAAMGGMLGGTEGSRQYGSNALQNLIGLQQQGQGQSVQGLGGLAQMLQSQQGQQLAGIGGVQNQAWNQNMQDIGLQNMFMQQEQQRRDSLMQQLLGQTQPTMPSIPGIAPPQRDGGGGFLGSLGGMAGMLAGSALGPFGSAAGKAAGEKVFGE